ncbi:MAG: hypothetical protein ACE5H6_05375, partial [Dehalococcoidia bacterium]
SYGVAQGIPRELDRLYYHIISLDHYPLLFYCVILDAQDNARMAGFASGGCQVHDESEDKTDRELSTTNFVFIKKR